jgi:hypothetical protein
MKNTLSSMSFFRLFGKTKTRVTRLSVLLAFVLAPSVLEAAKYYVSVNAGSDANSSAQAQSSATPWKTVAFAISQAAANDQLVILPGTYSETNIVINKSLDIVGNETAGIPGTGVKPVFNGTSPVANGFIFRLAADNIRLKNLELQVNQVSTLIGIFSPAGGFNGLRIEDNHIFATNPGTSSVFNSFGMLLGQLTSIAGQDSVVIVRNVIKPLNPGTGGFGRGIRMAGGYGRIGGADPSESNEIYGAYAVQVGSAQRMFQCLNNHLFGVFGALEINIPAGGYTHLVRNNVFSPVPGSNAQISMEIKNNTLANAIILVENNQFTGHPRVGLFSTRSRNVFVRNNIFTPSPSSSEYIHISVNTKQQTAGNDGATWSGIQVKGNEFLGGIANGGTGIRFANHFSGVYPAFQNTEIGGAGADANRFAANIQNDFSLDAASGPSNTDPFWGAAGSLVSLMRPVSQNFDIRQNLFDVGAGHALPASMNTTDRLKLEDKIVHGLEYDSLGFVTVVPQSVFVTQQSFLSPYTTTPSLQRAIRQVGTNNDWTLFGQAGNYPGAATVTTDLTVDVENTGGSIGSDQLEMNAPGRVLSLLDGYFVNNQLSLTAGHIQIQNGNFSLLGSASVTGGGLSSYVRTNGTGMFRYGSLGNVSRLFPIGTAAHYFPLQISNGGTTDNIGARVQDDVLSGGLSGSSVNGAVNATWVLDEATAGGSDLSISTSWNGSNEKPSFNRTASYLQGFSGSWTNLAGPVAATGTNPYSASFSGVTASLNQLPVRIANYSPVTSCQFQVVCFQQGLTHSGAQVPAGRSNPANAEVAQKSDVSGAVNFYSLGFQGSITLKSSCPVNNGPGNDIKIWETTFGAQPVNANSERARVYASQDGIYFTYLGLATYDGSFDLGARLPWAQYFRIVDATVDYPSNSALADAYDVDGIEVLNGYTTGGVPNQVPSGGAASICGGTQGKAKNFSKIVGLRSDPTKALGLPQSDNTHNFYSLGFGGDVCLKFDYAIFDGPGGELKVVETTFGNSSCSQYKERAEIAVSFDGVTWSVLGEYCQDYNGTVDITAANSGIQYVRVRDVSNRSDFSSTLADGYDVDAVVATSPSSGQCPSIGSNTRVAVSEPVLFDQTTVPDDMEPLQIQGNPVADQLNIRFTLAVQEATISVYNHTGQKVLSEMVQGNVWDLKEMKLDASALPAGVYFLSLSGGIQKETISFVKK